MGSDPTHSTLVSWQLNDNNRSAWDILWACASTIFACTWTVIHTDVPNRDASNFRQTLMFLRAWLMALLVPEVIFAFAWLQLMNARVSKNLYNIATTATTHGPAESRSYEIPIYKKFKKPLANSESEKWSLAQAFCIGAGGLALRTEDKWVYSVLKDKEMVALIESGILKPSDLPEQEIRSRAKADSFAKIFTLFQVLWFLCNAFTRWGYHLSVSTLELVTVAYVAIAILTYLSWWYKPKDISTPILVILSCDRETLEKDLLRDIDSNRWTHLQIQIKEESILNTITSVFEASIFVSDSISQDGEVVMKKNTDAFLSLISHFIYSFAALAYSGIHLAA
ncbi:hypothetical protein PENSTE_c040G02903 [Penicillium steckii]|uniref:Uncharacterized protein n=1 Tax=Penicillium steckii TaxID=303698 RepID=A0A1V6SIV7_9EURO|nr:hypothetical protein PENSTE_c040G02903 [Penicillium steckii]